MQGIVRTVRVSEVLMEPSLFLLPADKISQLQTFNVGTADARIFLGPASDEFGYTVQQAPNYQDKW